MTLPVVGFDLWCFATFLNHPLLGYGFSSDGCTMCPDSIYGMRIARGDNAWPPLPCDLHDFRYWYGGTELDRIAADYELRDAIVRLAEGRWWPFSALTRARAFVIYEAVDDYGRSHFNYWGTR